jgi:hypothetical protein
MTATLGTGVRRHASTPTTLWSTIPIVLTSGATQDSTRLESYVTSPLPAERQKLAVMPVSDLALIVPTNTTATADERSFFGDWFDPAPTALSQNHAVLLGGAGRQDSNLIGFSSDWQFGGAAEETSADNLDNVFAGDWLFDKLRQGTQLQDDELPENHE